MLADSTPLATRLAYSLAGNLSRRLPQLRSKHTNQTTALTMESSLESTLQPSLLLTSGHVPITPTFPSGCSGCSREIACWPWVMLRNRCCSPLFILLQSEEMPTNGARSGRRDQPLMRQILVTYLLNAAGLAQCG